MFRHILVVACVPIIFLQTFSSQGQLVKVNGFDISVRTSGMNYRKPGEPVLIFENGWGMDQGNWRKVSDALSPSIPLILYDRAGIGVSEDNLKFPNLVNRAEDLKNLLVYLDVPPPYILKGHSVTQSTCCIFCWGKISGSSRKANQRL